MMATVAAGGQVTANFAVTNATTWRVGFCSSAGSIPSAFSSWGGTNELEIKPDVAAPGGNIYNTNIEDSWTSQSGTFMTCAYVAGIAALYIGQYGGRSVHGPGITKALVNRIISSGAAVPWQADVPVGSPVDCGFWAPVPQVGTGLVNATKVLDYTASLTWENFHLNDTAPFQDASPDREGIGAYHTYDFNLSFAAQSFPMVAVQLRFPTSTLQWDIFEEDWTETQWNSSVPYPPVRGQNGHVGSAAFWSYSDVRGGGKLNPDEEDEPGYWGTISFPLTVGLGLDRADGRGRERVYRWF